MGFAIFAVSWQRSTFVYRTHTTNDECNVWMYDLDHGIFLTATISSEEGVVQAFGITFSYILSLIATFCQLSLKLLCMSQSLELLRAEADFLEKDQWHKHPPYS